MSPGAMIGAAATVARMPTTLPEMAELASIPGALGKHTVFSSLMSRGTCARGALLMPKGVEVALEDDEHDHVLPGGLRIGLGRCAVGSPRRAVHGDLGGRVSIPAVANGAEGSEQEEHRFFLAPKIILLSVWGESAS